MNNQTQEAKLSLLAVHLLEIFSFLNPIDAFNETCYVPFGSGDFRSLIIRPEHSCDIQYYKVTWYSADCLKQKHSVTAQIGVHEACAFGFFCVW